MLTNSENFPGIWNDLKNNTLLGTENYANTPTAAYHVLYHYKNPEPPHQTHAPTRAGKFVQLDGTCIKMVPGNDGQSFAYAMCYHYQEMWHYLGNCLSYTSSTHVESKLLQTRLTMAQTMNIVPVNDIINKNLLLLDT